MSNLKQTLHKLKDVASPFHNPIEYIDNRYVSQLLLRYNIISFVVQEVNRHFAYEDSLVPPSPKDVLEMNPVVIANEPHSIESLVELAVGRILSRCSDYTDFVKDVLRLYILSRTFTLVGLKERTIREIIYRLPEDPEYRVYRFYALTEACTVYFVRNRYMIISNKGLKKQKGESNIDLVMIIDMGTMINQILNQDEDFDTPTVNCSVGKLKPVQCVYDARLMNPDVYLSDVSIKYPYTNTFVESISKRKNYSFNVIFSTITEDLSIPNEMWSDIQRSFGISNLTELLDKQELNYV